MLNPFLTLLPGSPCSDSNERDSTKEDNVAPLRFHLKYEADVLFTRWAGLQGPQEREGMESGRMEA